MVNELTAICTLKININTINFKFGFRSLSTISHDHNEYILNFLKQKLQTSNKDKTTDGGYGSL